MNTPSVLSTFILTLLLMAGLFFFIRASVKDRTEQIKLLSLEPKDLLLAKIKEYFEKRAYHLATAQPEADRIVFQGFVRPSFFLAIFLTFLAAIGLLCLALVLAFLYPPIGNFFLLLVLLAPGAGLFYWKGAGRLERVFLKIETLESPETGQKSSITLTAHRDELFEFRQTFPVALENIEI